MDFNQQKLLNKSTTQASQKSQSYEEQQILPKDYLKPQTFQYYSLGHVYNDLGGAMYFNYLFFFLKRVVNTKAASAMFLSGQVTDGAITPLLGYLSDRFGSKKYGQRTPWYFWGLLIFLLGFSFLYLNVNVIFGQVLPDEWQYIYYISANLLTNLGWACVQIANMSLIPTITYSRSRRSKLNNLRNSRTFTCSLAVLVIGTVLFSVQKDATTIILEMAIGFACIGVFCCVIYLLKIQQRKLSEGAKICRKRIKQWIKQKQEQIQKDSVLTQSVQEQQTKKQIERSNKQKQFVKSGLEQLQQNDSQVIESQISQRSILLQWLKEYQFYLYALFYLSSRVYINVSGTFLPFLIVDILEFKQEGAIMPVFITINSLVITVFQIITTFFLPRLTKHFEPLLIYTITGIISFCTGFLMLVLTPQTKYLIFLFAVLIGITQAILLNVSIDLMNQMIGDKVKSSGALIGIYGLLDKCSSGLIVYFITSASVFDESLLFKKFAVCVIPVSLLGLAGLLAIWKLIKQKKYRRKITRKQILHNVIKSSKQKMLHYHIQESVNPQEDQGQELQSKRRAQILQMIEQYKKDIIF